MVVKGDYEYYGTHWRSAKELDTDGSAPDQRREQYYSAGWQLVEERVDDGWTSGFSADRRLQYLWGIRYIDDIVMHREDHDGDGDFTDGGTQRWWHVTDVQFSTVAVLDDSATIHERVTYDAYGKARHHDDKDVDRDGDFDSTDRGILTTLVPTPFSSVAITSGSYNADCDLNRDGVLNITDVGLIGTSYVSALAPGELSSSTVKNTIGWDGYVFNPEIAAGRLYLVRFRTYDTGLGRWVERDRAGYIDGMSLYQTVTSSPVGFLDPTGLTSLIVINQIVLPEVLRSMYYDCNNPDPECCDPALFLAFGHTFINLRAREHALVLQYAEEAGGICGTMDSDTLRAIDDVRRQIEDMEQRFSDLGCDRYIYPVGGASGGQLFTRYFHGAQGAIDGLLWGSLNNRATDHGCHAYEWAA